MRDYACFLIINFLLRNCLPTDPEDYVGGTGYETNFLILSQVCNVLQSVSSDSLNFHIIERVMDCLVGRKNDARLKQSQKDEILRRLSELVSSKFPNPKFIKHDGYRIIGKIQLNRYRPEVPVAELVAEALRIPNSADRGHVLFEIGLSVFRSDRGKGQTIVDQALTLIRRNASAVERIDRLIHAADELRAYSVPLSRSLLKEAKGTLQSGGVEDDDVIRRLVDVACELGDKGDDFARELAGALDDDKAKKTAQRQLALRALKQKIIDETSISTSVSSAVPNEYSQLGRMLLSSLQSGRIDSIRLASAMKNVDAIAQATLSRSYLLMTWIVENAVERHSRDERASFYLRPLFEGTIASGELAAKLADQAFTRGRKTRGSEPHVGKRENQELLTRDQLLEYLRRWLGNFGVSESMRIVDQAFCPEDLSLIRLIRSINPTSRIVVVTRKSSEQNAAHADLREAYCHYWKDYVTEQSPPNTRFVFLETSDGRSPFPTPMILAESAGIALSTNFAQFGVKQPGSVRPLEPGETESITDSIQKFIDGEVENYEGSRVEMSMWRL